MQHRRTRGSARPGWKAARVRGLGFPGHPAFPRMAALVGLVIMVGGIAGVLGPAGTGGRAAPGPQTAILTGAQANTPPAITSADSAVVNVGALFTFSVTATGVPTPTLAESGTMPTGLTFTDNGNGTATITGTSTSPGGDFPITITAANGVTPNATQTLTLVNSTSPTITSPSTAQFATGASETYTITTTGFPAPAITCTTADLPPGLSCTDNGNGTGTISGSADSTDSGTYTVPIMATVADIDSTATLNLSITIVTGVAPEITSSPVADFTVNEAGSITITTTGTPAPTINYTFATTDNPVCTALQTGLTQSGGTGTLTISGTPTQTGQCTLDVTASNGVGTAATQTLPIIVGGVPAFTSADAVTAALATSFTFTVSTSGFPYPNFGWDNVPPGLTFTANPNGTATISGTPTIGGNYAMALSAVNIYGTGTQTLTISVPLAPTITSANSVSFGTGVAGTFTVTTTGAPYPTVAETGALPTGVTLTADTANGTATLAGTPGPGTAGTYPITITATNGVGTAASQTFTLTVTTVDTVPQITSAASDSFTAGSPGTFSVTSTGTPVASLAETGTLPTGITFTPDNTNGTAVIAGTSTDVGTFPITITASNGFGTAATQSFTLTISPVAPLITSAGTTTFKAGQASSFTFTTTGYPAPTLAESGTLPTGITFKDNGNGTGSLTGTPTEAGGFPISITATNSGGSVAQSFELTVTALGPVITSGNAATATDGTAFSFTVTTSGIPAATLSEAGALPPGLSFAPGANGTATLSGTPAKSAHGIYPLTFSATNSAGTTSQAFTLIVDQAPSFTSGAKFTETVGTAFSLAVDTAGYPTNARLSASKLPSGLKLASYGDGAGALSGSKKAKGGIYHVTITAVNAGGTRSEVLTLIVRAPGKNKKERVPGFTSAASKAASSGKKLNFKVTTQGSPTKYKSNVWEAGALPRGVSFKNNRNGTGTLAGTPAASSAGTYTVTLTASNADGSVTQAFVLKVQGPPALSGARRVTVRTGKTVSLTFKARGTPAATVTELGLLPRGMTWIDHGNGTATLSGVAVKGRYKLIITARNAFGSVRRSLTLVIRGRNAIGSVASGSSAFDWVTFAPFARGSVSRSMTREVK
jgi:large repetitive protein